MYALSVSSVIILSGIIPTFIMLGGVATESVILVFYHARCHYAFKCHNAYCRYVILVGGIKLSDLSVIILSAILMTIIMLTGVVMLIAIMCYVCPECFECHYSDCHYHDHHNS